MKAKRLSPSKRAARTREIKNYALGLAMIVAPFVGLYITYLVR